MKKLILSLSVVALATLTANAQISIGAKAGLNAATFTGADATSTNLPGKATKAGLNVGAIVNIPIKKGFSVEPGAYLSMEGCKVNGGTYDLTYINVPVMAKYTFAHVSKVKGKMKGKTFKNAGFSFASGPQVGFLTSAKAKPTNGSDVDIKDQLQSMDYSWAVAAAYTTARRFGFELKYNIGIVTIDKHTPKQKYTNSVFQINAFYWFSGKKK